MAIVENPPASGGGGGGGGVNSINSDTTAAQTLSVGTNGSDFNISNAGGGSHVLNLPDSSATTRGALNSTDWAIFNAKIDGTGNPPNVAYWQTASTLASNIFFTYGGAGDATGSFLGVGVATPLQKLHVVGNEYLNGFFQLRDDSNTNTEFAAVGYAQQVVGGTTGVAIQWMPTSGLRLKYALSGSAGDRLSILNDGSIGAVDGNVSSPTYSFLSDTNTGMYHSTTHVLDWAINGSRGMSLSASGLLVDPSATDANLLVGNQVRIGSGVSIASVNDALSANTPLEFRASTMQLTSVGANPITFVNEVAGPALTEVMRVAADANGGQVTIGNSSAAGLVSSTQRFVDISQTITDFSATNSWRLHGDRLIVDPAVSSTSDTATASLSQVSIPVTNANDFGNLISNIALASHAGGGTLAQNIVRTSSATLVGAGTITTNAVHSVTAQALPGSAGTITNNYCTVYNSGNQSATSTIDSNFVTIFRTPRTDGTVTEHRAIYAEDQSGPDTTHFIYSEGGQSYHQGNFGIQNITPPAPLTIANNVYAGLTYDGAGGWAGTGTAIELLHGAVRSSWQSTTGEAGTLAKFGTETNHGLLIFTNDTTAIAINNAQQCDFSASATFEADITVNGRIVGALGTVTAANDITLPAVGNVISIGSSSTPVNTIDPTGWDSGSVVTLLCTSTFAFHHNTAGAGLPLFLAGSVDFNAVSGCSLTLALDGSVWQEIARKTP